MCLQCGIFILPNLLGIKVLFLLTSHFNPRGFFTGIQLSEINLRAANLATEDKFSSLSL